MRTRPATIATIVIALGLALTSVGLSRGLPYTFAGNGDRSTIASDLWAHGTAVSPALVALLFVGLLAAVAMRPTRGGRRAAFSLTVLAVAMTVSGVAEPAQQQALLLGTVDLLTPLAWAFHVSLVALALSGTGELRREHVDVVVRFDEGPARSGGEPVAVGRSVAPRLAGSPA
jgi:hypothetical protein